MKKVKKESRRISLKLIALLFVLSSVQVLAQPPHEFAVFGGVGFPKYQCKLTTPVPHSYDSETSNLYSAGAWGLFSSGLGGTIGGSFTGFTSDNIGFHVGLGLGLYRLEARVDSIKAGTYGHTDYKDNNRPYDLFSTFYDYTESHRTFFLTIPVMVQFQTGGQQSTWGRKSTMGHAFYAMAGFKLNVLLNNDYNSGVEWLDNLAHYTDLDNWAGTQEFVGYGHFRGKTADWKFDFSIVGTLALEAGGKWQMTDNLYLYTGFFFDYGLNDPTRKSRKSAEEFIYPEDLTDVQLLEFSERIHPMMFGLKLRMAFTRGASTQMACPAFN
jgi:hypothetical protein